MRAVIQRVSQAEVEVEGRVVGRVEGGLLVLLGVAKGDDETDARSLAEKFRTLRIFPDEQGKMNRSLIDVGGSVLLVSQFTLLGNTKNGRRPSFEAAAAPDEARSLYDLVTQELRRLGVPVETGIFAARMKVRSVNDGPVTFVLDSR
ncbi:MAG TPA: D-aminoacyl-tRNA deacylase [Nitrospira sp.]|nr:D-aminoacyl-tRNA deacylase [Nitrospira sp.]